MTYLLEGNWECVDHTGAKIVLSPGDVCWMSAGMTVIRKDRPAGALLQEGGSLHCLGITMRRASSAGLEHTYRVVRASDVPRINGPSRIRVLAGTLLTLRGALDPEGALAVGDVELAAGASLSIPVRATEEVLLYAYQDVVWIGRDGLALREGQVAALGAGDHVVVRGPEKSLRSAHVLVLVGPRL